MILGLVIIFYPGISLLLFVEIFGAFLRSQAYSDRVRVSGEEWRVMKARSSFKVSSASSWYPSYRPSRHDC